MPLSSKLTGKKVTHLKLVLICIDVPHSVIDSQIHCTSSAIQLKLNTRKMCSSLPAFFAAMITTLGMIMLSFQIRMKSAENLKRFIEGLSTYISADNALQVSVLRKGTFIPT